MKNKYLFLFILINSFISACSLSETNLQEIDLTKVQNKVLIPDMKDSLEIRYSDLYSNVRYITLESCPEEAIIGLISRMEIANNGDFIIFDQINNKIVRYDSCGQFKNLIGERGHGPNEYISPKTICYDKYENLLIVVDGWTGKLLYFNLNGKMIKSLKVPFPSEIKVLDQVHLVLFNNYSKAENYNYLIVTKDGKECSKFEPIQKTIKMKGFPDTGNVFKYFDEDILLCRSAYSSIIYKAQADSIIPYIEMYSTDKIWAMSRPNQLADAYKNTDKAYVRTALVINGKVILEGYNFINNYPFLYINDLQGHIRAGQKVINDVFGYANFTCFLQNKGNNIYKYIKPEKYEELLDSWKDRTDIPQKDREFVTRMANSINPIIQVCTVKD